MDNDNMAGPSSTGSPPRLAPLGTLATWVHRPAAVAKCFLADVYSMRPLLQVGSENMRYAGRDVFMLGTVPCKMVEVVAWVSGITHRESSMVVYLDDGDGRTILPVTVKLPLVVAPTTSVRLKHCPDPLQVAEAEPEERSSHFRSATERAVLKRKVASEEYEKTQQQEAKKRPAIKVYERKDVRVGDTVRVRGRVDEWFRRKAGGAGEWVRELVVEEGSGGWIVPVHPDEQFEHTAQVVHLHGTKYAQPFTMPPVAALHNTSASYSPSASPTNANRTTSTAGDITDMSSEMPSELSVSGDLSLRPPRELRSSQLTDRTFRQYLLDHISQATSNAIASAEAAGPPALRQLLEDVFPEYRTSTFDKGKQRVDERILRSTSPNSISADLTPIASRYFKSTPKPFSFLSSPPPSTLQTWTIASILEVPHLAELARLVVDSEAKKEERRRRRRMRDGNARPRDYEIEQSRLRAGRKVDDWHLRTSEKERRMQKLGGWCIRGIHEDGGLVQVDLGAVDDPLSSQRLERSESMISAVSAGSGGSSMWSSSLSKNAEQFGYIPLTPPLVLPLLLDHFEAEQEKRRRVFLPKNDPRRGSGMAVEEALGRLRAWGAEGRWERVGEWVVEEAIELGVRRGMLRREGRGWWATESEHCEPCEL